MAFAYKRRKHFVSKLAKPRGYRQSFIDEINNENIGKGFRKDSNVNNMVEQAQFEPRKSYSSIDPQGQGRYIIHINPYGIQQATNPPGNIPQYNVQCPMTIYKPWEVPKTQEFTTECCMKLKVSTSDKSRVIKKGT